MARDRRIRETAWVVLTCVALAVSMLLAGVVIVFLAADLSGCPLLGSRDLLEARCETGWQSEASWCVFAVGYTVAFAGPLAAVGGYLVVRSRRRRRFPLG